jgi:hypothetical protein
MVRREQEASRYIADYLRQHPGAHAAATWGTLHANFYKRIRENANPDILSWKGADSLVRPSTSYDPAMKR